MNDSRRSGQDPEASSETSPTLPSNPERTEPTDRQASDTTSEQAAPTNHEAQPVESSESTAEPSDATNTQSAEVSSTADAGSPGEDPGERSVPAPNPAPNIEVPETAHAVVAAPRIGGGLSADDSSETDVSTSSEKPAPTVTQSAEASTEDSPTTANAESPLVDDAERSLPTEAASETPEETNEEVADHTSGDADANEDTSDSEAEAVTKSAPLDDPTDTEAALPTSFEEFGLSSTLLEAVAELGWTKPTKVQARAFGPLSDGRDLMVQSHTGSGKTGAFCLPWLATRWDPRPARDTGTQLLVVLPTRELAKQVCDELTLLAKGGELSVLPVYGGTPMVPQLEALAKGVQAVVGTPGRLLDHVRRRSLKLNNIRTVVLDECDEMLSMGFLEDIRALLDACPDDRQTCLFSATLPDDIVRIGSRYMNDPIKVELSTSNVAAAEIDHVYYTANSGIKTRDLVDIVMVESPAFGIVFCNTREETRLVASVLQREGFQAEALSSDLTQAARERVLGQMRDHKLRFLVATDIAARGIDISHVSHVINYSFPSSSESYVHRTGRTGRAGRKGRAISIVAPQEIGDFYILGKQYAEIQITQCELPSQEELETRRTEERLDKVCRDLAVAVSPNWTKLARQLAGDPRGERVFAYLLSEALDRRSKRNEAPDQESSDRDATPTDEDRGRERNDERRGRRSSRFDRNRGEDRGRRDRRPRGEDRAEATGGSGPESTTEGPHAAELEGGRRSRRDRMRTRERERSRSEATRNRRPRRDRRETEQPAAEAQEPLQPTDDTTQAVTVEVSASVDPAVVEPQDQAAASTTESLDTDASSNNAEGANKDRATDREVDLTVDEARDSADEGTSLSQEEADANDEATADAQAEEDAPRRRRRRRRRGRGARSDESSQSADAPHHFEASEDGSDDDSEVAEQKEDSGDSSETELGGADPDEESSARKRRRRRSRGRGRRGDTEGVQGDDAPEQESDRGGPALAMLLDESDDDGTHADGPESTSGDEEAEADASATSQKARRNRRRRRRHGRGERGDSPAKINGNEATTSGENDSKEEEPRVHQDEIVINIDETELEVVRQEFGEFDELGDLTLKGRRRAVLADLQDRDEVVLEDLSDEDEEDDDQEDDPQDQDQQGESEASTTGWIDPTASQSSAPTNAAGDSSSIEDTALALAADPGTPKQPRNTAGSPQAQTDVAKSDTSTSAARPSTVTGADANHADSSQLSPDDAQADADCAEDQADARPGKKRRRRRRRKKATPVMPELTAPPHRDFWEAWSAKYSWRDFEEKGQADDEAARAAEQKQAESQAKAKSNRQQKARAQSRSKDGPESTQRSRAAATAADSGDLRRVSLNVGRAQGLKSSAIRALLSERCGLSGRAVRDLTVGNDSTLFQLDALAIDDAKQQLSGESIGDVKLELTLVGEDEQVQALRMDETAEEPAAEASPEDPAEQSEVRSTDQPSEPQQEHADADHGPQSERIEENNASSEVEQPQADPSENSNASTSAESTTATASESEAPIGTKAETEGASESASPDNKEVAETEAPTSEQAPADTDAVDPAVAQTSVDDLTASSEVKGNGGEEGPKSETPEDESQSPSEPVSTDTIAEPEPTLEVDESGASTKKSTKVKASKTGKKTARARKTKTKTKTRVRKTASKKTTASKRTASSSTEASDDSNPTSDDETVELKIDAETRPATPKKTSKKKSARSKTAAKKRARSSTRKTTPAE